MNLEQEVRNIQERNLRVEADKAWETSLARRASIVVLTYAVVTVFLISAGFPRPYLSAFIPVVGFYLSTLSLAAMKKKWLANWYHEKK